MACRRPLPAHPQPHARGLCPPGRHDRAADAEVRLLLAERRNIIVSGGTGTGKTTLLRALLAEIATDGERLVIIEDTPELAVPGDNVVHLHTTLTADLAMLLRQTCASRPTGSRWARSAGRRRWSSSAP